MKCDFPNIRVEIEFKPSRYSRKGFRIYRAEPAGGSIWAFIFDGQVYVCDTLQAAYNLMDDLAISKMVTALKVLGRTEARWHQ